MTTQQLQPYRPVPARPELPQQPAGLDHMLDALLFMTFRHKWKIAVCVLLGMAAAAFIWFTTPVAYRSEARLLVRYVAESTGADPASLSGRVTSPDGRGANIMQSELGILTSREIIEKVVDEVGPARLAIGQTEAGLKRATAILEVSRNLQAQTSKDSSIILISYQASDPSLAQDVLARITQHYLQKHLEVHRAGVAYDFLAQQTDQMASRLLETEQELHLAKTGVGVSDIEKAKAACIARVDTLSDQLSASDTRAAGIHARIEALQSFKAKLESSPVTNDQVVTVSSDSGAVASAESLAVRLRMLREREARLLIMFTDQSALVQSVRGEINKVDEELRRASGNLPVARHVVVTNATQFSGAASDALLNANAEMAALIAEREVINKHLEEARQAMVRVEAGDANIRKLQRRRDIEEANFVLYSKNLEQARVDDALDSSKVSNISVVQKASLPLGGLRVDLYKRMGIALALGLLAGFGLSFVFENGVHSRCFAQPSQVAKALGIPLLAAIPRMSEKTLWRQVPGQAAIPAAGSKPGVWSSLAPMSAYCERLHHRIMLSDVAAKRLPVIGVTGCSHGSGVSTIASGIATSMAREEDARVLVTSASLDSGAEVFVDQQGRVTVVDWNRTVIEHTGEAGTMPEVASPLRRFRDFQSRIEGGNYRCVVLDLPPVHENGTALALASSLDGVVIIIESEKDHRAVVRHCLELLGEARVPVLGAVLNKFNTYVPRWLSGEA